MAKAGKSIKPGNGGGVRQKHLHSRISYLYQAAVYLSNTETKADIRGPKTYQDDNAGPVERVQTEGEQSPAGRFRGHRTSSEAQKSKAKTSDGRLAPQKELEPIHGSSKQIHQLLASMRSISQKSQISLSQSIKRSVCRRCNGLLTMNSKAELENLSRGGRSPCADVLVIRCCQCGLVKRYPVGIREGQN